MWTFSKLLNFHYRGTPTIRLRLLFLSHTIPTTAGATFLGFFAGRMLIWRALQLCLLTWIVCRTIFDTASPGLRFCPIDLMSGYPANKSVFGKPFRPTLYNRDVLVSGTSCTTLVLAALVLRTSQIHYRVLGAQNCTLRGRLENENLATEFPTRNAQCKWKGAAFYLPRLAEWIGGWAKRTKKCLKSEELKVSFLILNCILRKVV